MGVPRQFLQAHDVQSVLQQMGRIGMPERVGGKLLLRVYLGTAFLDGPLDARRGKRSYRTIFGDLTVENVFYGVFGPEIGHQAPGKVRAQRTVSYTHLR